MDAVNIVLIGLSTILMAVLLFSSLLVLAGLESRVVAGAEEEEISGTSR